MKVKDLLSTEYHPYFKPYIDKVGDLPLIESLIKGKEQTVLFFKSVSEEKLSYKYEEGKWTIKDILLHLIDSERVFCYRALQIARSENAKLEGFDENEFVLNAKANSRNIDNLLEEYAAVRDASILLFSSFSGDILTNVGLANKFTLSVRASGFLICGHEIHHKQIIEERYL